MTYQGHCGINLVLVAASADKDDLETLSGKPVCNLCETFCGPLLVNVARTHMDGNNRLLRGYSMFPKNRAK